MKLIRQAIRWLLVPVSAAAVVASCTFGARWAIAAVDARCPPDSLVAGSCVEPWHTTAVEVSIYLAVAVGAFALVWLPALVAPQLKRGVAVVAFLLSVAVAGAPYFYLAWADLLMPFVVATLAGAAGLWWVWSRRFVHDS